MHEGKLPRVLVLEDDRDQVSLLKEIFKEYAIVDVARNSSEFFLQFDTGDPVCLCILDNFIGGDPNFRDSEVGIRILETLRDYEGSSVPIIFTTAEPLSKDNRSFAESRTKMYPKPFNSNLELLELAKELIEDYVQNLESPTSVRYIVTAWLEEFSDDPELSDAILILRLIRKLDQSASMLSRIRSDWRSILLPTDRQTLSINIKGQGIAPTKDGDIHIDAPLASEDYSEIRVGLVVDMENYERNNRTLDIQFFDDREFKEHMSLSVTIATDVISNEATPKIRHVLLSSYRLIDPNRKEEPILTLSWTDTKIKPMGLLYGSMLSQTKIDHLTLKDYEGIKQRLLTALQVVESQSNLAPAENDRNALNRIKPLVDAGQVAFNTIFRVPDVRYSIGRIMHLARVRGRLPIIRIITDDEHLIPWDLVYSQYIDWRNDAEKVINQFWGMGCVVEHMLPGMNAVDDVVINNSEKTYVSLVRNQSIVYPEVYEMMLMAGPEELGRLALSEYNNWESDIALKNYLEQPADIIQFVGHGIPDNSSPFLNQLNFGDRTISPFWLNNWEVKLEDKPLVIVNACQSLHSIPDLFGSFQKAFLECGARGVLGTLIPIKALFASRFMTNFYEDFLNGSTVGEALYFARRNCWEKTRTLFGLLYIYYGSLYIHLQNPTRAKRLDVCSVCLLSKSCIGVISS